MYSMVGLAQVVVHAPRDYSTIQFRTVSIPPLGPNLNMPSLGARWIPCGIRCLYFLYHNDTVCVLRRGHEIQCRMTAPVQSSQT